MEQGNPLEGLARRTGMSLEMITHLAERNELRNLFQYGELAVGTPTPHQALMMLYRRLERWQNEDT